MKVIKFGFKAIKNVQLLQHSQRNFAPKAPAKGGKSGGGPSATASAFIPKRGKTPMQEMVEYHHEIHML